MGGFSILNLRQTTDTISTMYVLVHMHVVDNIIFANCIWMRMCGKRYQVGDYQELKKKKVVLAGDDDKIMTMMELNIACAIDDKIMMPNLQRIQKSW
jgi:hypothetical protein